MGVLWQAVQGLCSEGATQEEGNILLCLKDPLTCPSGSLDTFELALCLDAPIEEVNSLLTALHKRGLVTHGR